MRLVVDEQGRVGFEPEGDRDRPLMEFLSRSLDSGTAALKLLMELASDEQIPPEARERIARFCRIEARGAEIRTSVARQRAVIGAVALDGSKSGLN